MSQPSFIFTAHSTHTSFLPLFIHCLFSLSSHTDKHSLTCPIILILYTHTHKDSRILGHTFTHRLNSESPHTCGHDYTLFCCWHTATQLICCVICCVSAAFNTSISKNISAERGDKFRALLSRSCKYSTKSLELYQEPQHFFFYSYFLTFEPLFDSREAGRKRGESVTGTHNSLQLKPGMFAAHAVTCHVQEAPGYQCSPNIR